MVSALVWIGLGIALSYTASFSRRVFAHYLLSIHSIRVREVRVRKSSVELELKSDNGELAHSWYVELDERGKDELARLALDQCHRAGITFDEVEES